MHLEGEQWLTEAENPLRRRALVLPLSLRWCWTLPWCVDGLVLASASSATRTPTVRRPRRAVPARARRGPWDAHHGWANAFSAWLRAARARARAARRRGSSRCFARPPPSARTPQALWLMGAKELHVCSGDVHTARAILTEAFRARHRLGATRGWPRRARERNGRRRGRARRRRASARAPCARGMKLESCSTSTSKSSRACARCRPIKAHPR